MLNLAKELMNKIIDAHSSSNILIVGRTCNQNIEYKMLNLPKELMLSQVPIF